MIDHRNGGEVTARLYLKRGGAKYAKMRIMPEQPIKISMTSDAEVKMNMQAQAEYDGEIDYFRDTLVPALVFNSVEYPVGEFVIGGSTAHNDGMRTWYDLTGYDLTQRAKRLRTENRAYFPAGMLYTDAVGQMLTTSGLTNYMVETSNLVLQTSREDWERGENHLAIINALLGEMNYNTLYMGLDGIVRAMKYRQPDATNVTVRYGGEDAKIVVPGSTIEVDAFDHFNVFYYTCENADLGAFFTATAENNSAGNRFSTQNQGRVPDFRQVDNIASQATLQAICDRACLESMIAYDTIDFQTGINTEHNAFDIVSLNKKEFSGIVQETEWSMELRAGAVMQHRGKKAVLAI